MPGVADSLIGRLRDAGTRAVFGLPGGGGNLDLIEAAGRAGLPFVLTATETGSAIAALAQAEITGAPGACLTTLGPGAASVVNGVACAMLDRAPLLVITDRYAAGGAAFEHQRLDHHALLASVTRWSGSLAPEAAFRNIEEAFGQLAALPPGPVHLDCPADFEETMGDREPVAGGLQPAGPDIGGLKAADYEAMVASARRPVLIVGLAARKAADAAAIREFCENRGVPALVTYKAKGVVPDSHPWFAGVFTHAAIERAIVEASDLIIGVGFDPVEILPRPWTYSQPVISIAPWRMADDHVPFQAQHVGSISEALRDLASEVRQTDWDAAQVRAQVDAGRQAVETAGGSHDSGSMTAQDVVRTASRFASQARLTVDAGAHMFAATMLWPAREPNDLLISNGLSTMGFALPAAIGAAFVDRTRPVIALTGDGGLLICLGELATAARERLQIIVLVLNDSSLSLIEIKQQHRRLGPGGVALGDLNWSTIAAGFGLPAWTARTHSELERALDAAATVDGPSLIDARIDRSNYAAMLKAIRG